MAAAENLEEAFDDESMEDIDLSVFVSNDEVARAKRALLRRELQLKDVAGFTSEEIEAVYARGIELLRLGMCKKAARLFFALCLLDRRNARFIRALGLTYHYERKHRWAHVIYGQALVYDPTDVIALALRAECTLLIDGKREAVKELQACLAMPIRNRHDLPYVERAKALLAKLSIYQGDMK